VKSIGNYFLVIKEKQPQENWESVFPIKLCSLACSSMINASIIGSNLLGFGFGSYERRRDFDSKSFATQVLGFKGQFSTTPHLEDLRQDYKDEEKVLQRDYSTLTLQ
jgi:hypothetical protein